MESDFSNLDIHFNSDEARPHIVEIFDYQNDGTEGVLEFDGYYYVNDSEAAAADASGYKSVHRYSLPLELQMIICENLQITHAYEIEIYKREIIHNTNQYAIIDDGDGNDMSVCFFPTDRQKLYFRVLDILIG